MALQFSRVTLYNKTDDSSDSFLARGIPREFADLEYYTHFDNFINYLDGITDIDVEVDTFLYGEGEVVVSTIEELAYLHLRMQNDDEFLERHAHYAGSSNFTLHYNPYELWGAEQVEDTHYFDKNGTEIKSGMELRMEDGSIELVYDTTDAYGNPDLGINASNEDYLERHPYASREYFSLCNFDLSKVEIVEQKEVCGMTLDGM